MAAASLEAEGWVAIVEPSNMARGFAAPFAAFPLGIGVMVPASQAEAAASYLTSAGLLELPDTSPSRLVLQARDAMWLAVATVPLFFLAPIAYIWAASTRRELDRVRDQMPSEDHQLAWRRATRARWFALVGILIFVAVAAFLLIPAVFV